VKHKILSVLTVIALGLGGTAAAQLSPPNGAGVAMGHLHYHVKDVEANRKFWIALGAVSTKQGTTEVMKLPGVLIVLTPGPSSGGTNGSVNHVAFRVQSFAKVEEAGFMVQRLAQFPGVGSINTPEGERIELFENTATNLTFTQEGSARDAAAERHNRPLTVPIAFHHVHLYLPDAAAAGQAKAWYARVFGGVPGKRAQYDATDVPGINLNFSAGPQPTQPTKGRMLDHVGFEVVRLKAFCGRLEAMGVVFDELYAEGRDGVGRARLTDPWGTSIELTEGLTGL